MKTFEITWTIKFSHTIQAVSRKEALAIADDMGDINADTYQTGEKKIRLIKT